MNSKESDLLNDILETIHDNLINSANSYRDYIENGKTYQYARELKKHNSFLRNLLSQNRTLLSKELQQDAHALIAHYDAWTEKWNALELELNPAPGDVFVFENEHRFPREAADNLEKGILSFKGKPVKDC